tara:strand:+ start:16599 stop:16808 length:210 start_codon:yes stop_codon:yes gene_type:complete
MFLSDAVQQTLRSLGKISQNEVLKKEGDLFVAINVEDQHRRIVQIDSSLVESLQGSSTPVINRRGILKG